MKLKSVPLFEPLLLKPNNLNLMPSLYSRYSFLFGIFSRVKNSYLNLEICYKSRCFTRKLLEHQLMLSVLICTLDKILPGLFIGKPKCF